MIGLLSSWIHFNASLEVPWFNNVCIRIGELGDLGVSIEEIYEAVSESVFRRFISESVNFPAPISTEFVPLGNIVGMVGVDVREHSSCPSLEMDDVLLTLNAYRGLADHVSATQCDLVLYFFRGGVPPALAVMEMLDQRARDGDSGALELIERFWWLPGLSHDLDVVGCDPSSILNDLIVETRAREQRGIRLCLIDTTFTGSTAVGKAVSALRGSQLIEEAIVSVDHCLVLPVEQNTASAFREDGSPRRENDTVVSELEDGEGRPVRLNLPRTSGLSCPYELHLFPLRMSITEDFDDVQELGYLRSEDDEPLYGYLAASSVLLTLCRGGASHTLQILQSDRRDSIHGWLLSDWNPARLAPALRALGLPGDRDSAVAEVLRSPGFGQYSRQGLRLSLSSTR